MVKVAAVFSVSGVGKGWLVAHLGGGTPFLHAQASQLLRAARAEITGRIDSHEELRRGAVSDNQALLVDAFTAFRCEAKHPIIFDGHVLVDAGHGLVEIPLEVIGAIAPSGLIFIEDQPAAIVARRALDTARSRPVRSENEILDHQNRARVLCQRYAKALDVRFTQVRAGDTARFASTIESTLSDPAPSTVA